MFDEGTRPACALPKSIRFEMSSMFSIMNERTTSTSELGDCTMVSAFLYVMIVRHDLNTFCCDRSNLLQ